MTNVYWCPFDYMMAEDQRWKDLAYFEPEPMFKLVAADRTKDTNHLKCPGVQEYFKNTFLVRAPVDYKIKVGPDGRCSTSDYTADYFERTVTFRTEDNARHRTLTLEFMYLIFSDEPVLVEMLPVMLDHHPMTSNVLVTPGTYDISKWVRPLMWSFEVRDGVDELNIKRGDPMFMLRFPAHLDINLVRVEQDANMQQTVNACLGLQNFVKRNSLAKNYEMAGTLVGRFLSKFLGGRKKCPFSFWRK